LQGLRRVFRTGFSVHDITEPLVSFDQSVPAAEARQFMEARKLEVIGVRGDGLVIGYAQRDSLGDGLCSESLRDFEENQVIANTTPLADVIQGLRNYPRLFVSVFGQVGGIVTKTDLQKPPVRMWLFGMVTLIEMRMTQMLEQFNRKEDWTQFLSDGRVQKAEQLLAERSRRNQNLDLVDCLQFSDKCQIIARNEHLRSWTRFDSRRQVEEAGKKLERLRNNLAHAQDIIATDWEALIDLSENFDSLLEEPPVS
jgi:CBS domain-containing protein